MKEEGRRKGGTSVAISNGRDSEKKCVCVCTEEKKGQKGGGGEGGGKGERVLPFPLGPRPQQVS